MTWQALDQQLAKWCARLSSDVKIPAIESLKLASHIASEVRFLPREAKDAIAAASPVSVADRLRELQAFQGWMDTARDLSKSPYIVRAQTITQNYICFVYLPESCFRVLSSVAPKNSMARKCASFLSNNPIRSYRSAIAHANWTYREDFAAIVYWARKGSDTNEPLQRFEVQQDELEFWQALSRCVAYATFSNL